MKDIHLIVPFSRTELIDTLIEDYRPLGVTLHLIMFRDEAVELPSESWIRPFIVDEDSKDCEVLMPGTYKRNRWIEAMQGQIVDDDYYVTVDDDDFYESNVFEAVREMDDDIVIISMKRGHSVPKAVKDTIRDYPTSTLWALPENVTIGTISAQQLFVKGRIFREHLHNEEFHCWDGEIAEHYKETGEQIAYRPDLFALFNWHEPGRWKKDRPIVSFGCLVNDVLRLDMVLRKSEIEGDMHFVKEPESATKGLNKLLEIMEDEGADIAVLTHQDVFFRQGWLPQLKAQLAKLPDSWIVAGIIGKDMEGRVCGQMHDMRIPLHFNSRHLHEFPQPACCFDECVIIVNLSKGFRFDETLDGFDLYGTLCVLQTWEMGGTAWVIDAFCEHYCMRPFSWCPDEAFSRRYKWLHDRFLDYTIDTTVLAVDENNRRRPGNYRRFETSAA